MAEQSATDFKSTFKLLQTVQEVCRSGEVRKLADAIAMLNDQAFQSQPKRLRQGNCNGVSDLDTKTEESRIKTEQMKFSPAPQRAQAARRKVNKAQKALSLQRVRRRAKLMALGKTKRLPTLDEVQVILSQRYSFELAAKMVDLLPMKEIEVCSKHTIQRMNVGQPLPNPESIPMRDACAAAIADIDILVAGESSPSVYLARWDAIGYATLEQLEAMLSVIDARAAMIKPPFNDCVWFSKVCKAHPDQFKDIVANMTLNKYTISGEDICGVNLLSFREKE
ncbi:uncharacterized protein KRP23_7059 [Phytophthora ramorum]|uniref:uncharacterized protein n=1 Tax=Phytophthora ramorum TaxID=164328 RepID=UPI0030A2EEA2|nr:hypothetical protein KRP23_7059 [Phytophthora ramorum]